MTRQPNWKLVANLGNVHPIDHGGAFVYEDATGVYVPELEVLQCGNEHYPYWQVYRFDIPRCTLANGVLSDNKFHPGVWVWFAKPESERKYRPQDTTYLKNVADFRGTTEQEMVKSLTSENAIERASAYIAIAEYHGYENFDSYPLVFFKRTEVEERYANDTKSNQVP